MTTYLPTFRRWGKAVARALTSPQTWSPAILDCRHGRLFTFGWKQKVAFVGLLGGIVAVMYIANPSNPVRVWYWMNVVGPKQEVRYGFKARLAENQPYCVEVSHVERGGAFDQAGVREGWVFSTPNCFGVHTSEIAFGSLRAARSGSGLRLLFVLGGCPLAGGRHYQWRAVTVVAPKGAA
jgi:hypothetical protein